MTLITFKLRYLSEEKKQNGRYVLYVRWKGKRIRLREFPSSPEFIFEYRAALEQLGVGKVDGAQGETFSAKQTRNKSAFPPQSFGWLVHRYLTESPAYQNMNIVSKKRRRSILEDMILNYGHKPMFIPAEKIAAGLAARSQKPEAANTWLKSIKALYTWAASTQIIKNSPAKGISAFKSKTEGFYTWSMEDTRVYVENHPIGTMGYLACILLLFTGLRRSDAVKLSIKHMQGDIIRFQTSKTGSELVTKIPWPLAQAIEALSIQPSSYLLKNNIGNPFASGNAFGNWFKDRCTEAGLPHCTPHGLRKGGASIAAENGASEVELDAMYGWSNNRQSGTYTRAARNLLLATNGFDRIANALLAKGILYAPTNSELSHAP